MVYSLFLIALCLYPYTDMDFIISDSVFQG